VAGNKCSSRTAIHQPGTGQREKNVWFSNYGVWAEISQDGKRICKEESVSEFVIIIVVIIFI
jgi:hypothetical protein